jgi:hypothetical protein
MTLTLLFTALALTAKIGVGAFLFWYLCVCVALLMKDSLTFGAFLLITAAIVVGIFSSVVFVLILKGIV